MHYYPCTPVGICTKAPRVVASFTEPLFFCIIWCVLACFGGMIDGTTFCMWCIAHGAVGITVCFKIFLFILAYLPEITLGACWMVPLSACCAVNISYYNLWIFPLCSCLLTRKCDISLCSMHAMLRWHRLIIYNSGWVLFMFQASNLVSHRQPVHIQSNVPECVFVENLWSLNPN